MATRAWFLIDNTNPNLKELPQSLRLRDVGLTETASDDQIFDVAVDRELTIVTNNDNDFIKIMNRRAAQSGKSRCAGDGYGLLVPNQAKTLDLDSILMRMKYNARSVDWSDVGHYNLKVSVGDKAVTVTALARCDVHRRRCLNPKDCGCSTRMKELGLDV